MCFSAPVSFVASAGLGAVGTITVAKAPKNKKLIALVPFIFAIQQFIEGLQWLVIGGGQASLTLGYLYLFFAFLFWPIFLPTAIWFIYRKDKNKKTTQLLQKFIGLGSLISLYLVIMLFKYPVSIVVVGGSINYDIIFPAYKLIGVLYIATVSAPFLVAKDNLLRLLGLLLIFSAIFSYLWFTLAFTSTWCFFAAVLSGLIYLYIGKR